MSLLEDVQKTIATTLKVAPSKVTAQTRSEDLSAWDSLGQVNVMMALEQTFDVFIEVEDFDRLKSVDAIVEYLSAQGKG
jgi:acyl carrier protein